MAIDDFSRELYAAILPDKTQNSAARFLTNIIIAQCSYQIDCIYSDNAELVPGPDVYLQLHEIIPA